MTKQRSTLNPNRENFKCANADAQARGILAPLSIIFIVVFVIQSTLFERTQIWREIEEKRLAKRKSTERAGTGAGKEKRENGGMNESMKLIVCSKEKKKNDEELRHRDKQPLLCYCCS